MLWNHDGVTILVGVLLGVALVGTVLSLFVVYSHGVIPLFRSLVKDPDFIELWQQAGLRFRFGIVGAFFGAFVGGGAGGLLLVTGHLWQGAARGPSRHGGGHVLGLSTLRRRSAVSRIPDDSVLIA